MMKLNTAHFTSSTAHYALTKELPFWAMELGSILIFLIEVTQKPSLSDETNTSILSVETNTSILSVETNKSILNLTADYSTLTKRFDKRLFIDN